MIDADPPPSSRPPPRSLYRDATQEPAEAGPHGPGADFPARGPPHLGRAARGAVVRDAARAHRGGRVPGAARPRPGVGLGRRRQGRRRERRRVDAVLAWLLGLLERQHAPAAVARRHEPCQLGRPGRRHERRKRPAPVAVAEGRRGLSGAQDQAHGASFRPPASSSSLALTRSRPPRPFRSTASGRPRSSATPTSSTPTSASARSSRRRAWRPTRSRRPATPTATSA